MGYNFLIINNLHLSNATPKRIPCGYSHVILSEAKNLSTNIPMETKPKELYEAPSTMVFEVRQEGVICGSLTDPDNYNDGGDPFAF